MALSTKSFSSIWHKMGNNAPPGQGGAFLLLLTSVPVSSKMIFVKMKLFAVFFVKMNDILSMVRKEETDASP